MIEDEDRRASPEQPSPEQPVHAPEKLRRRIIDSVRSGTGAAEAQGRARTGRVGGLAAIVLAVAAVLTVTLTHGPHHRAAEPSSVRLASGGHGARATLVRSGGRFELLVSRASPPPFGETYQVWLQRENGSMLATDVFFNLTSDGRGDIAIPGSLHGIREILVTSEPTGGCGCERPAGPALLTVRLSR
jgi:hypothetical protein